MLERNVTPQMIEYWARTGKALQQAGDKMIYITKQGAAVINSAGKLITVYSSVDFDAQMIEIVQKLFGK